MSCRCPYYAKRATEMMELYEVDEDEIVRCLEEGEPLGPGVRYLQEGGRGLILLISTKKHWFVERGECVVLDIAVF